MKKIVTKGFNYLYNQPYLLLILTMFFWGGNMVNSRYIAADFGPLSLAFIRWGIAVIILTPFALKFVKADWQKIKQHWFIITVLAISGISIYNTFVYIGVKDTTAINAVLTTSLAPVFVYIWSFVLFRQKISLLQMVAIIFSLCGIMFIIFKGNLENVQNFNVNKGDLTVLVAIAIYGFYSALLRKKPTIHWFSFIYMTFLIGELMLLPFFIWELTTQGNKMFFNVNSVATLIYISIFASILAYIFFNRAVALVGANGVASFFHLIPVFGTILAIIFLGEELLYYHIIGFSMVIFGIYMGRRKQKAPKAVNN
ncbi:MAG: DMT family transporter [Rhizobiales bacterium]|nr:DMT family transporter [Hyphomicrobiales bacterium]NRB14145.1 DMT family transporter [Hyphomicrobiales bacterium]